MADIIGQELSGYRILKQIGRGGMARVFKAYQPAMDRVVALKLLPDLYAEDERARARFRQEARIIANLEHPHILPVYDFGEEDGTAFLVMRYLQAGNLKHVLEGAPEGRLALSDAALLTEQIASALDYAHGKGIVHRDVKPANVLIDPHGQAFLTDFGIAKVLEATQELTKTGSTLGTPAYMSPEQAAGGEVDHRSDIYSLGIILYEMLTGRPPFEADTPYATVVAYLNEPLPLPSEVNPDIPEAVEQVLLKSLSKEPAGRYKTAGELAQALLQAVQEGSGEFRGETVTPAFQDLSRALAADLPAGELTEGDLNLLSQITRTRRRLRMVPWLVGGFFLMVLVAAGGLIFRASRMASESKPGVLVQVEASPPPTTTEQTFTPTITLAPTITTTPTPTLHPMAENPYLGPVPEGAKARLGKGTANDIDLSPDGKTLAIGGSLGVWLYDAETYEYQDYFPYNTPINKVKWSPEGDKIAAGTWNNFVVVWDLENNKRLFTLTEHEWGEDSYYHEEGVISLDWDPKGTVLASGSSDGNVILWDSESGEKIRTLHGYAGAVIDIDWSPEGNQMASAGANILQIWDAKNKTLIKSFHVNGISSIAWTPEGYYIAVGSRMGSEAEGYDSGYKRISIFLLDVQTETRLWEIEYDRTSRIEDISWSSDGMLLTARNYSGKIFHFHRYSGKRMTNQDEVCSNINSFTWTGKPDRIILGYSTGQIKEWDINKQEYVNRLDKEFSNPVFDIGLSPDQTTLVSTAQGSTETRAWDLTLFSFTNSIQIENNTNNEPRQVINWSPSGDQFFLITYDNFSLIDANEWTILFSLVSSWNWSVSSADWSPDGTKLIALISRYEGQQYNKSLFYIDPDQGNLIEMIKNLNALPIYSIKLSPTDNLLASLSQNSIIVWNNTTGERVYTLQGTRPFSWSHNGLNLAVIDGSLSIFYIKTGEKKKFPDAHTDAITSLSWAPNNRYLASGSRDNTIILWNPETRDVLATLEGHNRAVTSVEFSSDGSTLASGSEDGTIILWDMTKILD